VIELARELARGPVALVETQLAACDHLAWRHDFAPVADELENGRGFTILQGPADENLSLEIQLALYWVVGQFLGEPVAQKP
jgi:hypothetical protein